MLYLLFRHFQVTNLILVLWLNRNDVLETFEETKFLGGLQNIFTSFQSTRIGFLT